MTAAEYLPVRSAEDARRDAFRIASVLGVPDACRLLGVSSGTLAAMCTGGDIPPRWRRFLHTAVVMLDA